LWMESKWAWISFVFAISYFLCVSKGTNCWTGAGSISSRIRKFERPQTIFLSLRWIDWRRTNGARGVHERIQVQMCHVMSEKMNTSN
jgi:hypothetical protein